MKYLAQPAFILFLAVFAASCAPRLNPLERNLAPGEIIGTWYSAGRIEGAVGEMTLSIRSDGSCGFERIPIYDEASGKIRNISGSGQWDTVSYIKPSTKTRITKLTVYPNDLKIGVTMQIVEKGAGIGLEYSNDPESATVAIFTKKEEADKLGN